MWPAGSGLAGHVRPRMGLFAGSAVKPKIGIDFNLGGMPKLKVGLQINWRRALTDQHEDEEWREGQGEDADNNGVPDDYDEKVTTPGDDTLHLKFPETLFRENDYVRYMPRNVGFIPQPVAPGSKGLIRSEDLNAQGQFVMIKWNALNPPGKADAPLTQCNSMDLFLLGHV